MKTTTRQSWFRACLLLGYTWAVLLLLVVLPLGLFEAYFWSGMQFRESVQPTTAGRWSAFIHEFIWMFAHRLWFLFLPLVLPIWCAARSRKKVEE